MGWVIIINLILLNDKKNSSGRVGKTNGDEVQGKSDRRAAKSPTLEPRNHHNHNRNPTPSERSEEYQPKLRWAELYERARRA